MTKRGSLVVGVLVAGVGGWWRTREDRDGCWSAGGCDAADDEARGKAWWAHVQVLADDSMRGRHDGESGFFAGGGVCGAEVPVVWAGAGGRGRELLPAGALYRAVGGGG